jgi:hypothetical protein
MTNPQTRLEMDRIWCKRHWNWWATNKKANGLFASVKLFQMAVARPEVMKALGYDEEKGTKANAYKLNEVLPSFYPLCCLLGDEELLSLLEESSHLKPQ